MALVTDLLQQAHDLAVADKKKPKQASTRRAVSTAYYALFHAITDKAATALHTNSPDKVKLRVITRRAFDHMLMREVGAKVLSHSQRVLRSRPEELNKRLVFLFSSDTPISHELAEVIGAFERLQVMRHKADYDLSQSISREDALSAYKMAQRAVQALEGIPTSEWLNYSTLLMHGMQFRLF